MKLIDTLLRLVIVLDREVWPAIAPLFVVVIVIALIAAFTSCLR